MEEQLSPLAVTHLLQHTLRSLCIHEDSQWVYAVFWRILPRNFPPPRWDLQGGALDRSRGNRRNWILAWEDGFCNFSAFAGSSAGSSAGYGDCSSSHHVVGLQPELFFKMSHEIYSYGEGLIGKVAADHSHKWVFKDPQDHEVNLLPAWQNPIDSYPRTWEAQFQSGIKTIALIAVREGVIQLGAVTKVMEDLSYVVLLRKKFSYLESIPGVLLPHPLTSAVPISIEGCNAPPANWAAFHPTAAPPPPPLLPPMELLHLGQQGRIVPSTSSLEALLSKLPSIGPSSSLPSPPPQPPYLELPMLSPPAHRPVQAMGLNRIPREDVGNQYGGNEGGMEMPGRGGSSMSGYYVQHSRKTSEGY